MSIVQKGDTVSVHYVGSYDNGEEFDSSHAREAALSFQVGSGQLISGFDSAVIGMKIGETKKIRLTPKEAYGEIVTAAIQKLPLQAFPEDFEPEVGVVVHGNNPQGQQMVARIHDFDDKEITLDFNHPMAGKTLNFEIEIVEIDQS